MRTITILLVLAAGASAQEKRELRWSLKEGEKFAARWKLAIKGGHSDDPALSDVTNEFSGKLSVVALLRNGRAECMLTLSRVEMTIKQGAVDAHILVEDGTVEKAEGKGADKAAANLVTAMAKPITLTISPLGECEFAPGDGLGKSLADIEQVLGPTLPTAAVATGGTWKAKLTPGGVPRAARQWGFAPVEATYTLKEDVVVDGESRARITLEGTYDAVLRGVKGKHELAGETLFDTSKGRCTRSKVRWKTTGRGDVDGRDVSFDFDISLEFGLGP